MALCECQCGRETREGNRYIHGHNYPRVQPEWVKAKISASLMGHTLSPESTAKMIAKKMGQPSPMKGIPRPHKRGENSGRWQGDNIGYEALHYRMRNMLSKPEYCQLCNKKPAEQLACVTRIYNMDLINWKYLCCSCHVRLDYEHKRREGFQPMNTRSGKITSI